MIGRIVAKREAGNNLVFVDIVAGEHKVQVLCEGDMYVGREALKRNESNATTDLNDEG